MSAKRCLTWGGHAEPYLTDELTGRQRWLYEEHLAGCAACREELGQYEELFRRLRSLPSYAPPGNFEKVILENVCPEPDAFAWLPHGRAIRTALVTVFVLAAAAAFVAAGREMFGRIVDLTSQGTAPVADAVGWAAVSLMRTLVDAAQAVAVAVKIGVKFLPLYEAARTVARQVHPVQWAAAAVATALAATLLVRLLVRETKGGVSHARVLL
jgi:predicted anti-sigma-YlaC factor YlaD